MKVFITGGSGWVGRHVVPELLKHGHSVTAIARSDNSASSLEKQGASVIRGGLEDTDTLHQASKEADAVIHLAYIHDFSDYGGRPAQVDFAAIRAMCSAHEGTNKPFIGTSGTLGLDNSPAHSGPKEDGSAKQGPRQEAEKVAFSYGSKGVRSIVIRLAPSVHGKGDKGFMPFLISNSKEKGFSGYIKNTEVRWPGCHVNDAAVLYRLAVENGKLENGTILYGVTEDPIPFPQIAKAIGDGLGLETKALESEDEVKSYFSWLTGMVTKNSFSKHEETKALTGWQPKEIGLLEDLKTSYF